jgi:hypothetical protein
VWTGSFFLLKTFFAHLQKNERRAGMITRQPDGIEGLPAASSTGHSEIHQLKLAKLAIVAGTAAMLVGFYIGTKHFFSIESSATEQLRVYHLDIGETCLREPPHIFEAREGDRIVLTVTSLYSGKLYVHGLEEETNVIPGAETAFRFTAAHAGRYYLHLHGEDEDHAHAELAVLEVAPR